MSLWKWNDVELEIDMEDYDFLCRGTRKRFDDYGNPGRRPAESRNRSPKS